MADSIGTVQDVLADTREHGGGTYDPYTFARVDFADGYVVAMLGGSVYGSRADDADRIAGLADALLYDARAHDGAYVGTWQDGPNLHVDIVEHFAERDKAIRCGIARGQISVWDCANACEIPTGGTGSDNIIGA